MSDPTKPQPPPKPNDERPIWDLVIDDMRARDTIGRERYGTPLQAHNGREPLVDAYEEVLDLAAYLRQEMEERTSIEVVRNTGLLALEQMTLLRDKALAESASLRGAAERMREALLACRAYWLFDCPHDAEARCRCGKTEAELVSRAERLVTDALRALPLPETGPRSFTAEEAAEYQTALEGLMDPAPASPEPTPAPQAEEACNHELHRAGTVGARRGACALCGAVVYPPQAEEAKHVLRCAGCGVVCGTQASPGLDFFCGACQTKAEEAKRLPCPECGRLVREREDAPYSDHAADCRMASRWRKAEEAKGDEEVFCDCSPECRRKAQAAGVDVAAAHEESRPDMGCGHAGEPNACGDCYPCELACERDNARADVASLRAEVERLTRELTVTQSALDDFQSATAAMREALIRARARIDSDVCSSKRHAPECAEIDAALRPGAGAEYTAEHERYRSALEAEQAYFDHATLCDKGPLPCGYCLGDDEGERLRDRANDLRRAALSKPEVKP